ncbi:MAG: hypothetical protein AABM67_15025 [Acidobacteriota bacterium]
MLIALALSFIAIASGTLLTYTYEEDEPLASRLCSGACIGFALLGLIGFALALAFGLGAITLVATAVLLATPGLLLLKSNRRAQVGANVVQTIKAIIRAVSQPRWAIIYFLFYSGVIVSSWLIFSRAMLEKPEGIFTGVLNNFGDLPFHLSVITRFAFGENFPPEDPTFAGVRFTYPFITDFISAMFVRAGASLRDSMFIENWILGIALIGVIHRFGQRLLRNRTAAILTPLLVVLNGGFGWAMIFTDVAQGERGVFQVLAHLKHSYTILPDGAAGWRWGNAVTSLLVTQRGFLLGIPLAVIVFTQWWTASPNDAEGKSEKVKGKQEEPRNKKEPRIVEPARADSLFSFSFYLLRSSRRMLAAGVVAGLLPLIHAHSFIAVMLVGTCLALINLRRWRMWLVFLVTATLIALPQMLWSTHGSAVNMRAFIAWQFGWDSGTENFFWFWLKNTGLFIPLLIAALLWRRENYLVSRRLLFFYLPFTLCFIIPNLVKLAPWVWDNVKILFYWWIASAPLVALLLARLWEGSIGSRVLAATFFVILTLAGGLDVFALVTRQGEYGEFDRDGVNFAEMIKQRTPPRATILHAPVHNTPVFLTGRRSLMGYPGHIWTHGLDYGPRERDIKQIYAGEPDAAYLLEKYGVDYVVVDPQELSAMKVNAAFFSRYREVANIGEYHLYKIKP